MKRRPYLGERFESLPVPVQVGILITACVLTIVLGMVLKAQELRLYLWWIGR